MLHDEGRSFYLCPSCGRSLSAPGSAESKKRGRRKAKQGQGPDPFGHATDCERSGMPPQPAAIVAASTASTLRLEVVLPHDFSKEDYERWGLSLGYALRTGLRQIYMLDGPEIEIEVESMWESLSPSGSPYRRGCLTFIDDAMGGSGFLERAAAELHLVAARSLEHLEHANCESACYRCLKSYQNQRFHSLLSWPLILGDLELLSSGAPEALALELGDIDDPQPWLEAYAAGVGSPLELKFLRLFEQHGLDVDKQVPVP